MTKSKNANQKKTIPEEIRKIESEVFDRATLLVLAKMMKKGVIAKVDWPISTGKEANVFRATTPEGSHVAIKIYKIKTTPFYRRGEYLEGDPRFKKIKHTDRDVILAFARKEFKNLQICKKVGVHTPKPLFIERNVLVLTFIGEGGVPYPTMNVVGPRSEADLEIVLNDIKKMYEAGLVHADISEFNLLLGDVPYLIDFGQGVLTRHPNAEKFLRRDVKNVLRYFEKFGYKRDFEKVMKWIKGKTANE